MTVYSPVLKFHSLNSSKSGFNHRVSYFGQTGFLYSFFIAAATLVFVYLFLVGSLVNEQARMEKLEERLALLQNQNKTLTLEAARLASSQNMASRISNLAMEEVKQVVYLPIMEKIVAMNPSAR